MEEQRVFKTAADILAFDDIPVEEVRVEEWKTWLRVRGMSGRERDDYEASIVTMKGGKVRDVKLINLRARLVARCVVDDQGKRLFTDAQIEKLGGKSAAALETVFKVAQRLSGLSDEDVAELEENLEATQNEHSGSS